MEVVNLYKVDKNDPLIINIQRPNPLGNPFIMVKGKDNKYNRDEVINKYKAWLLNQLVSKNFRVCNAFRELSENAKLACTCKPQPCHGDVIKELYEDIYSYGLDFDVSLQRYLIDRDLDIDPSKDGITHINMYSKGITALGKWLSHFTYAPFNHPDLGCFNSIEGLWYYVSTGQKDETLRNMFGYNAKTFGRNLPRVQVEDFEEIIKKGIRAKFEAHPVYKDLFTHSELKLKHYYKYGDSNAKIYDLSHQWYVKFYEELRIEFKQKETT